MANFEQLFPTFLQKCAELHELLRLVAFLLFIVGTILLVAHGFSAKTLMLQMVRLFVLTALLVMLPQWGNQAQQMMTRFRIRSNAACLPPRSQRSLVEFRLQAMIASKACCQVRLETPASVPARYALAMSRLS